MIGARSRSLDGSTPRNAAAPGPFAAITERRTRSACAASQRLRSPRTARLPSTRSAVSHEPAMRPVADAGMNSAQKALIKGFEPCLRCASVRWTSTWALTLTAVVEVDGSEAVRRRLTPPSTSTACRAVEARSAHRSTSNLDGGLDVVRRGRRQRLRSTIKSTSTIMMPSTRTCDESSDGNVDV
jgi:hypothetical protein